MTPRVRFAPSPTGYLHVGGARTALFNWLFAHKTDGTFVLRIEDTDRERSTEEHTKVILDGLHWLGIGWDEGPYFQGASAEQHRADAERLLAEAKAYRCFCTREELDARRAEAEGAGSSFRYDRRCWRLSPDDVKTRLDQGLSFTIRFFVPDEQVAWNDAVHGPIQINSQELDDFVILRSDGSAIYNLAVVSDDIAMRISHVIRGDDHISNTPKQILLYRALGHEPPAFAHLPLILGSDKKRLSKRHGAVSVTEYRDTGILPAAMRNFLALLGWSPGDGREVMTREELVAAFDIAAVNRKGAVFDEQKLEWLNSEYIQKLPGEALYDVAQPYLEAAGLLGPDLAPGGARRDWFLRVLETLKARSRRLTDFPRDAKPFLGEDYPIDPQAAAKYLTAEKSGGAKQVAARLRALAAAV